MKKTVLFSAIIAMLAMTPSSYSQVRVTNSGQVRIGNYKGLYEAGVNESSSQKPDEGSTLVVMPLSTAPLSGGRVSLGLGGISFGCLSASSGRLELDTKQGMVYKDNGDVIFSYSRITAGDPVFEGLIFNTDITVPSTWTTSDARLKKDINSLEGIGTSLLELSPVSYRLASRNGNGAKSVKGTADRLTAEEAVTTTACDDRVRYGFIAQEVQKIFPELVREDEKGMLAIDYIGFIPLLVDEIKSLTARLEMQGEALNSLSTVTRNRPGQTAFTNALSESEESIVLYQNRPNPFNISTEIGCVIPNDVRDAFITIYDMQGKQLHRLPVTGRGETSVTVDGSLLTPGMYIYSLIADGNEVASKRMILTD